MKMRKTYTKEFKLDAISLVLEQEYTRTYAAKSLGINSNMLEQWIKEHQADDNDLTFQGKGSSGKFVGKK